VIVIVMKAVEVCLFSATANRVTLVLCSHLDLFFAQVYLSLQYCAAPHLSTMPLRSHALYVPLGWDISYGSG
jgi:hypothetical protein